MGNHIIIAGKFCIVQLTFTCTEAQSLNFFAVLNFHRCVWSYILYTVQLYLFNFRDESIIRENWKFSSVW